jgi:hypothetical protein
LKYTPVVLTGGRRFSDFPSHFWVSFCVSNWLIIHKEHQKMSRISKKLLRVIWQTFNSYFCTMYISENKELLYISTCSKAFLWYNWNYCTTYWCLTASFSARGFNYQLVIFPRLNEPDRHTPLLPFLLSTEESTSNVARKLLWLNHIASISNLKHSKNILIY